MKNYSSPEMKVIKIESYLTISVNENECEDMNADWNAPDPTL